MALIAGTALVYARTAAAGRDTDEVPSRPLVAARAVRSNVLLVPISHMDGVQGVGSAFFIDDRGMLVSSYHALQHADSVAIIHHGRIMLASTMDQIRQTHCRMTLRFRASSAAAPALTGALSAEGGGYEWTYVCHGAAEDLRFAAAALEAEILDQSLLTLDEIFISRVLR